MFFFWETICGVMISELGSCSSSLSQSSIHISTADGQALFNYCDSCSSLLVDALFFYIFLYFFKKSVGLLVQQEPNPSNSGELRSLVTLFLNFCLAFYQNYNHRKVSLKNNSSPNKDSNCFFCCSGKYKKKSIYSCCKKILKNKIQSENLLPASFCMLSPNQSHDNSA